VAELAGGRYRTRRSIGSGGMARVLLGRDEKLDRQVAIKLLGENLAADDDFRQRFMREARMAAKLSHPNVVQIFDVGEEDGVPFLVMEYVDGSNLGDLLKRRRSLPRRDIAPLMAQTAAGLGHAHDAGLVHRDVKPQNLLRRKDGRLKIADFGIARALEESRLTDSGSVLGTRPYMAPEQLRDGKISPATDVYAFGVVAHELLTGEVPSETETAALAAGGKSRGRRRKPVPPEYEELVSACLDPDPGRRPSAKEIEGRLEELGAGGRPTRPAPALAPDPERTQEMSATEPVKPGMGEQVTAVTQRVFNRMRRPGAGKGRLTPGVWLALFGGVALVAVILVLAVGDSDQPEAPEAGPGRGGEAGSGERVEPAPQLENPSEQSRALAEWLRDQAR
jgi:eukaryotic-like serine/threonine-protein kinase